MDEKILNILLDIKTDIGGLKKDVEELKAGQADIRDDIVEIKDDIVEMKGDIVEMKGDIVEVKGRLGTLEADMTVVKTTVKSLADALLETSKEVKHLKTKG